MNTKSWDLVQKWFILDTGIAGPCNSTEKNPQCGKKLNYKQLLCNIHTHAQYYITKSKYSPAKTNTQVNIHPPISYYLQPSVVNPKAG